MDRSERGIILIYSVAIGGGLRRGLALTRAKLAGGKPAGCKVYQNIPAYE